MPKIPEELARQVMLDAGFDPQGPYQGANVPWPGSCLTCGAAGSPRYKHVSRGIGACRPCGRRKAANSLMLENAEARQMMLDADFEPFGPYPGSNKPWPGKCLICGSQCSPKHSSIKQGSGACRLCGNAKIAKTLQLSEGDVLAVMRAAGFEPTGPYPGADTPWLGVCLNCGKLGAPRYNNVNKGRGACLSCGRDKTAKALTLPENVAVEVMRATNFEPSVPYPGSGIPWEGVCLKCGRTGTPRLASVQSGGGACGYCAGKKVDPDVALIVMRQAGFEPVGPYPGSLLPWPGTCTTCGNTSTPSFHNVQRGQGPCALCAGRGYDPGKPAAFYIVRSDLLVKGGISNRVQYRLETHARQGLTEVLSTTPDSDGAIPQLVESSWKEMVRKHKDHRVTKRELPDGHTEAMRRDPTVDIAVSEFIVYWSLALETRVQEYGSS